MKILTLNTWQKKGPWKERWEIIFQGLQQHRPDVAAFQEVFNRDWAEDVKRRSGFEYLVFPEEEPAGLMLLSRFPVREWEYMTLATQSPTEEYRRYALYAKLEAEGGKGLSFFNTHLSWRLDEGEVRKLQAGELLEFIRRRADKGIVFVAGDFNAPPQTPEIHRMMLESGFIDLFGVKNPGEPGLTWKNSNPFAAGSSVLMPDRRIDYIFMQGISITKVSSVQVVFTEPVNGIFASDHFGVLAEIT